MQRQYQEMKKSHPDSILFFRLGDFYEMFGEDAHVASRILGITLTARHKDMENPIPMCGIPYHAVENYIVKLTKAGKKVAIAEQLSDPKLPGIVKREVIRIITPGTTFSDQMMEAKENLYLLALAESAGKFGLAFADLSTGDFIVMEADSFEETKREIMNMSPKEIVLPRHLFSQEDFRRIFPVISTHPQNDDPRAHLLRHFGTKTLRGFGIEEKNLLIESASLLLAFLEETQKGAVPHMRSIRIENRKEYMPLDSETIRNLELFSDNQGEKQRGLVALLDETKTSMGGRKLRKSILRPMRNREEISARLDAVKELTENPHLLKEIQGELKGISDLERLIAKISCRRGTPRDLVALKQSIQKIPGFLEKLRGMKSTKLEGIRNLLSEL